MPTEPIWLPFDLILEINQEEVAETGEHHFLRDEGLLRGALARPQNLHFYEGVTDLVRLATHLLFAIALSHSFEQGNKRTGWTAAVLFLQANGCAVLLEDYASFGSLIVSVIEGGLTEATFARILSDDVEVVPDED